MYDVHKDHGLVKGDKVVICGGGESGCDGGYELALDYGKNVTIVEMYPIMAKDAMFINRDCIVSKMEKLGVRLMPGTKVRKVEEAGVTVEKEDGSTEFLPADTVINALGMKPRTELIDAIQAKYHTKTVVMGDSAKMAKIGSAVRSGFYAAMSIDR
ncbi:MAG: FAD-dependent oxidoreductase [Oscillospiraceae bacterium]|nr:FAD-dependent oxidoreductase [Oscillospiraceae bacterium]